MSLADLTARWQCEAGTLLTLGPGQDIALNYATKMQDSAQVHWMFGRPPAICIAAFGESSRLAGSGMIAY